MRGRLVKAIALIVLVAAGALAIGPVRHAVLRRAGRILVASDAIFPSDLLTMDVESGLAGALMLADLYRANLSRATDPAVVGLLVPRATAIDRELRQRGIVVPDVAFDVLVQLGIPGRAIVRIPAGEGGTTETTGALAAWARARPGKKVLVVVGPSHGRRYQRALRRAWPAGQPAPAVVTTTYAPFHADDWWQSRTTLREGLVELEKLVLDLAQHPF
ncbi:MAG TPA: hypothetical protein VKI43_02425 [Vicinamibacterales bacterium]|nr:hypothetical protein [Vicinamibacterales bacterium]